VKYGIDEGERCVIDGRSMKVNGFEKGNFVGKKIIKEVMKKMKC
jgi:malonate-semialdehyde dehydrogenase (acetylating)/methylmalonate-semialdehyde dehydrogenase